MENIINKILDTLKGSPTFVFSLVVLYMVIKMLGSKIDTTNKILTDLNANMAKSLEHWEQENNTKEFTKLQQEILDKLGK